MKVEELRVTVKDRAGDIAGTAQKAAYAAVGAPVVVGRRIAEYGGKVGGGIKHELDAYITEGEKLAERMRERNVVDEIKDRVDIDQLQDRVERLRDQLEEVLAHWRESFRPQTEGEPAAETDEQATVAEAVEEAIEEAIEEAGAES